MQIPLEHLPRPQALCNLRVTIETLAHAQEFLDAAPRVRVLLLGWYLIQSQQNILSVRARNSMDVFVCLYKYAHSVLCVQQVL